jgi:DNA-binding transcriptional MerR regulator
MRIGELARRTGTTTKTIRYYEGIGLVAEPDRSPNGYRDYGEDAVDRLAFIRDAQATGLTLAEIASILDLRGQGEATCEHVIDLLDRHLAAIDEQIQTLQSTRSQLAGLIDRARRLDAEACVDPIRCQTIGVTEPVRRPRRSAAGHDHASPARHRH